MPVRNAPLVETGYASGGSWLAQTEEPAPELRFPLSLQVYDAMRRQDAQIASVQRALTLPVRRTPWRVDPNGARDEVVEHVAEDLGLPIVGAEGEPRPRRTRDRFSWQDHVRHALLALPLGFMPFEQVYRISDDGRAHLRKLAPRMPKTVEDIMVARDGGLVGIKQWPLGSEPSVPIPVNRLVMYVNDREGGDWYGQSILRSCYKNWLIKDRMLRVQAQAGERNGMGIPVFTDHEEGDDKSLDEGFKMVKSWKAGENAAAALRHGQEVTLLGVQGVVMDLQRVVDYHDQQIARSALGHFMTLGGQTGSWALGSVFADFFTLSLQTVAEYVRDVATQHVVEDLVDVNWGEGEPAPKLIFDEIGSRHNATAEAIRALLQAGALRWDPALEQHLRIAYGLPPASEDTPPPAAQPQPEPAGDPNAI